MSARTTILATPIPTTTEANPAAASGVTGMVVDYGHDSAGVGLVAVTATPLVPTAETRWSHVLDWMVFVYGESLLERGLRLRNRFGEKLGTMVIFKSFGVCTDCTQ